MRVRNDRTSGLLTLYRLELRVTYSEVAPPSGGADDDPVIIIIDG